MELNFDSDLQSQLELLKERLKNKEKEITEVLQSQKEEYERNLKERDEEVNQFVDALVKENLELKKTTISLEIDLQTYKEKLMSSTTESDDRIFYDNLKQIKESKEMKQKEIVEKYEKYNKNLQKEIKQALSNLKRLAYENKQRIIMGDDLGHDEYGVNNVNLNTSENLVSLTTVEENFGMLEKRIKILHEELNNKEKYSLVIEQKYEMVNEENKMIKRKLQEERTNIMRMIEEIQQENSSAHQQLMVKINSEIYDKKHNLEQEIANSLGKSEDSIRDLIKAKNRLTEEVAIVNEKLLKATNDVLLKKSEIEKLEDVIKSQKKEIDDFENIKSTLTKEIKELKIEIDIYTKANDDLTLKLNDAIVKVSSLETANKVVNDSINREIEKAEIRIKQVLDNQNAEIINLSKQLRDLKVKYEDEKEKFQRDSNKMQEMAESVDNYSSQVDKLNSEIRVKEMNIKMLQNSLDDANEINKKLKEKQMKIEEELSKYREENKRLKEKLADSEIEITAVKKEIERVTQLKNELFNNFEEAKKSNVYLNNQFETFKMTNNIEMQRMKNQLLEQEKMSDKVSKLSAAENANSEIKKEIRDLKQSVSKLYKVYLSKLSSLGGSQAQNQFEERKMLEEIEMGIDRMVSLAVSKIKTDVSVDPKLVEKYEEEIKSLKKKLNTVAQITNSVNRSGNPSGNNSIANTNTAFKTAEKDSSSSLYESVVVHLKNLNLKHLLEIFQLNIQREEEIRLILNEENSSNINSANSANNLNLKKQIADLSNNFTNLKKLCEQAFQDHQQRARLYIQPEEFEKRLEEYKMFTQSLIDMVLDTLMSYKTEVTDAIVFRMPINDYNHFIEHISQNLDSFNKKVNMYVETYNKSSANVDKAIDVLVKNTAVDYDLLNNLIQEKFI